MSMPSSAAPDATSSQPVFTPVGQDCDLSVVIVNYNTAHLLSRCIAHLRAASEGLAVTVIIVDNASRDGSADQIRLQFPDCHLVANADNVGFGRANNQVLPLCRGRAILLLNADAYLQTDTLHLALVYLETHPRCGVLGVASVDEAGQRLFAGRRYPTPWGTFTLETGLFRGHAAAQTAPAEPAAATDGAEECDWVVGCCYFVRQSLVRERGLFDPRYFLYFEEVDHCRATRAAGWSVACLTSTAVVHVGGGSAATEGPLSAGRQISALQTESSLLYARKHGGLPGLFWALLLGLAGAAILWLKALLKRRPKAWRAVHVQQMRTLLRLTSATRLASRPTR